MERTKAFLLKTEGKSIADKVLTDAILKYDKWCTLTIAEEVDGSPTVTTIPINLKESKHAGGAMGEVKELLEEQQDKKILVCFSSEALDPPPYVLLGDDSSVDLVVALSGDFADDLDDGPEKGHSVDYTFAKDYLSTKVLVLADKAEGEMSNVILALQEKTTSKDLSKAGSGDHMMMFMFASNAKAPVFHRPNEDVVKYDWGIASHDVNEEENPKEDPVKVDTKVAPEPVKPKGSWRDRKAAAAAGTAVASGTVATGAATATSVPAAGKKEEDKLDLRIVPIPEKWDGGTVAQRKWFSSRTVGGEPPKGWEKMKGGTLLVPFVLIKKKNPNMSDDELRKKYPAAVGQGMVTATEQTGKLANVDPSPVTGKNATPSDDQPVVIPPEQIRHVNDSFFKNAKVVAVLGRDSKNIMDPALTALSEDKLPPFFTGMDGIPTLQSTYHFPEQYYLQMGSFSLPVLAKAAFNYKNECIKLAQIVHKQSELLKKYNQGITGKAIEDVKVKDLVGTAPKTGKETAAGKTWAERKLAAKSAA